MDDTASATGHDMSRPTTTGGDLNFTLSIEEVSERYAKAGHARTIRTLQRYCVSGHLDAQKVATTLGDKYLVTPQSVARHIEQIENCAPSTTSRPAATNRGQSRHPSSTNRANLRKTSLLRHEATSPDRRRQTTMARRVMSIGWRGKSSRRKTNAISA